jgi:ankyrin repeat protein
MSRIKKGLIALALVLSVVGIVGAIVWVVVLKKDYDLLSACQRCDAGEVRRLLERGADPNARLRGRTTALMLAASCEKDPERRGLEPIGDPEAVKLLLENGADTKCHYGGITPLHMASGRLRDYHDEDGLVSTTIVQHEARGNPEVIRLLLASGADPNAGHNQFSPLDVAMNCCQCFSNFGVVRLLVQHGATSHTIDKCDYLTAIAGR